MGQASFRKFMVAETVAIAALAALPARAATSDDCAKPSNPEEIQCLVQTIGAEQKALEQLYRAALAAHAGCRPNR